MTTTQRNTKVVANLKLVWKIVRSFERQKHLRSLDVDDAFQSGVLGLIHAIEHFKPDSPATFGTYAFHCITGFIKTAIRKQAQLIHIPSNLFDALRNPHARNYYNHAGSKYKATAHNILNRVSTLTAETPDHRTAPTSESLDVHTAINRLRANERQLIIDHFFRHRSLQAIASRNSVTKQAISLRLQKVLHQLRPMLQP